MTPAVLTGSVRDEQFRLLVEHVKDYAIFLLDPDGFVMTWNEGAERIKGYSADEIVGQHFSLFYEPEDRERGRPGDVLRHAQAVGSQVEEGWRIRKDGSRFWASVVVTPLYDGDRLVGFAKVTRDLTERKRADEERTQRLEAEAALRARDEFISVAAHELKTPVTAVKAAAQLLLRRAGRVGVDPSLLTALGIIEQQVDKLGHLVTSLLDSVRIQNGRVVLEIAPADVSALANEVAMTVSAATGRRIEVANGGSFVAPIDALRIEQVVTNLLTNAVKFSPETSVIQVTVTAPDAEHVDIAVRDHGIGVPPQHRARIFERYFQAREDRSGMGLGLYISRSIVEKHGGTIRAEFPEDGGSRFVVSLPR